MSRINGARSRNAGTRAIAAWSATLPDSYITCRDMGHTWRPLTAKWLPELNCYTRTLRCGRCATERHQDISRNGLILSYSYSYSEGFLAPAGTGRIDGEGRGQLRIESIGRLIGQDEQ